MSEAHLTGTIVDRYEIVERLGAGGMGEVYRARDHKLHRDVAIKRLAPALTGDPKYRERLLREARAAARVSHQGLAALYDVVEQGDDLFLVIEFVEGRTLRQVVSDDVLDVDDALKLLLECAEALAAAHKNRIVHRDVTPANIMVTTEGKAKLLDFGLAHAAITADPDGSTLSHLEGDSGIAGTPPYMAPEVLLGKHTDTRADIFSLGVVAYQVLTAKNPFLASTPTAVSDRILHLDPPPVVQVNPAVPGELEPIVRKMLAKDPDHRYATIDDVVVDLKNVRRLLRTSPSTIETGIAPPPVAGSRPRRVGLGLGAVAVAIAAAWYFWPAASVPASAPTAEVADADNLVLAVLSLHSEFDSPEDVALAEGLASTLAARLGPLTQRHEFQLVPSASLASTGVKTVADARLEFGCNRTLTIRLRREGQQLQANLGLVDATTGAQIIGDQIGGTADALFDFEDAVGDRVLRMLQLELRPSETAAYQVGTADVGAREFYLSGIGYLETAESEAGVRLAVEQFRQALRADPEFAKAHAALGDAYVAMYTRTRDESWLQLALPECEAAVTLDDLEAKGHACLGVYADVTGEYEDAVTHLERARALSPTDDFTVGRLAGVLRSAGRNDEAEQTYLDAIALRPHYALNFNRLGTFYLLTGRIEDAVEAYERAVQLSPDSYRNHGNLGNGYYFADDLVGAERAYRASIALNPDYGPPHSNLGTILFYQGRYSESADLYEQAANLAPAQVDYWGNLGDARWFAGQTEAAAAAFRRALELTNSELEVNPNLAEVQAQASYYLAMLGQPDEALAHATRAIELEPDAPLVLRKVAQTSQLLGRSEQAVDYLTAAIASGYSPDEVRRDPVFEPLRGSPALESILDPQ